MKRAFRFLLFTIFLFGGLASNAQDKIEWLTFEEVEERSKKEPRKVLVDVYTDWCGWCKKMDKTTYENKKVVEYVNKNFYAVKFDAEDKNTIHFNGNDFEYVETGRKGINKLAWELLGGKMSYPSTVFLDEKFRIITPVAGYLDANNFDVILHYIEEEAYNDENSDFQKYKQEYTTSKGK
ncbi:thioredoxin family protein [Aureibacter tunicatorum]|uniref:Thioredoxin-related protein n=1 Tax=Aureibacter tunicatorum TaxID=866807 RepID=A0AAE3XN75_9BACT|nr:DUF255 domain-containing protein [Aureibacter tunicatorum]MDR6238846.1 thioredoxin-related protein [Aureibacter tunicatorum]BDD05227.1 hypothetical protein AUTU_27100 [Aureibacter tunicatorum]